MPTAPIPLIELTDDDDYSILEIQKPQQAQKKGTPEVIILLTDSDDDNADTETSDIHGIHTVNDGDAANMTNSGSKSSFKSSFKKPSAIPSEEEIVVLDSLEEDTTELNDLFNLQKETGSKPIPSSPVKITSLNNDNPLDDSIVDSTFNFLVNEIIYNKKRSPTRSPSLQYKKPVASIPDPIRWLSSNDDNDDAIFPTSPLIPMKPVTTQPAKRSKSIQEPPIGSPPKRAKRSKTTDLVSNLPRVDDFQYTQKDLKEANRATRKKEEVLAEMELHMSSSVHELFKDVTADFDLKIFDTKYQLPIIFWKRNVQAVYDKERDIFIPCHPRKIIEKTFVMYYLASEFLKKLQQGVLKTDVASALREALAVTPNEYHIIIVVEGYDQLLNKIKLYEQRNFKKLVLLGTQSQEHARAKSSDSEFAQYPSSSEVDNLVNKAQIELQTNIFTVRGRQESIMWLNSFSYMIGNSIYDKFERNLSLANLGTVRSGVDTKSTFLQSMQQFKLMTQSKADMLYVLHKSVKLIYYTLRHKGSLGKDTLGRNIVPPSVDQAMYKFFTADDPNSVIS